MFAHVQFARVLSKTARRSIASRQFSSGNNAEDLKTIYTLGVSIAKQVSQQFKFKLSSSEMNSLVTGFNDSMSEKVANPDELLATYGPKIETLINSRIEELKGEVQKLNSQYMDNYMATHTTATKTASGLIYHETVKGIGSNPTIASKVKVHYHGMLTDGSVFDSSVSRGEPITFPLGNVIKGWQEGLAMMKKGGKATLVIPSDLGYGDHGSPPVIPGGSTLVFEVELIEIM